MSVAAKRDLPQRGHSRVRGSIAGDARRSLALGVLLFALLVRLAVPAGFMVAPAGSGWALVACPDARATFVAIAPVEHHAEAGHHATGHEPEPRANDRGPSDPCPYAALSAPVMPPLPLMVAAVLLPVPNALTPALPEAELAIGPAAAPPPARGPPVLI
jgi:hypothetical protein